MMNRRSFLELLGFCGVAALTPGCPVTVGQSPDDDGGAPDDALPDAPPDAPTDGARLADAGLRPPPDAGGDGVVIAQDFDVLLNDTSCSGHDHVLTVRAGTYPPGVAVHYLGGSHDVALDPSELKLLERGARLPFATGGDERGHGHCGLAWRRSVGPAERGRVDACVLRSTTSVCAQRPGG